MTELKHMNLIEINNGNESIKKNKKMSKHMIIERQLKEKMIEKENE